MANLQGRQGIPTKLSLAQFEQFVQRLNVVDHVAFAPPLARTDGRSRILVLKRNLGALAALDAGVGAGR